jgi:hypothetical protein
VCPPHRPDLNAFVERSHRTLKQECLLIHDPQTQEQVREVNAAFVEHYNSERPNQALSCGNQPPRVAFASLPNLPQVPQLVDPDAWLSWVDGQHVVRKRRHNGTVRLDDVSDDVKESLAGQDVDISVDATKRELMVWHHHQPLKRLAITGWQKRRLPFEPFVALMAEQACSEQRRRERARWRTSLQGASASEPM